MREVDLYQPIKVYLENLGYNVKAEVLNIDIMAEKDGDVILVEMKKALSFKLLYQGLNRQHLFDHVYIAIANPGKKAIAKKEFKEKLYILHRLRLGLILVDVQKNKVEVVLDPVAYVFRKNSKKKQKLLKEFALRQTSVNKAGINQKKIITVYREKAITIGRVLINGELSTKTIKALTNIPETTSILYKNYYKWFKNVSRGVYGLTELGFKEIPLYNRLDLAGGKINDI